MKHFYRLLAGALLGLAFVTSGFAQITWENQSPSGLTGDDIWCVTYANGTFAATTTGGKVLTSTDGLTWSSQTIAAGTWLVSIAYGNGKWIAVGAAGTILVSTDLSTWVSARAVTSNKLNGVTYANGIFVAVGDSATVVTSPDGLNWTAQAVPASVSGFLHGVTWYPAPISNFYISGAEAGNGTGSVDVGAVLAMSGTPSSGTQNYSVNLLAIGANLVSTSNGTVGNLENILYEPSVATVAVGWLGTIISSPNSPFPYDTRGFQFTPSSVPSVAYRGLTYGNGYWVVAGEQGTILTSTDSLNWTQRFSGSSPSTVSTATLLSAVYSSTLQRFVIVGTGGTILVSNAPPTVFVDVSTRGYVSGTQTSLIGGFVIQGTAPRTVLIRANGPVLANYDVSNPLADPVLTVYNSSGAVIATNTGWATNSNPSSITTAALEVGAFPVPNPSADSAVLITLQPGAYTAEITSAKGNSGTALVEAYTD